MFCSGIETTPRVILYPSFLSSMVCCPAGRRMVARVVPRNLLPSQMAAPGGTEEIRTA